MLRQFELIEKVKSYDPTADEALLNRAYVYAMRMHGAQKRASGDPYFAHPIEVAGILTDYRLDTATIVTALLHDVIEDTPVTRDEIDRLFGSEIGELVEGVTKLSKLELSSEHLRQAENLRKFILAISRDVRVLMVKLADRLHNMRTLQHITSPAKRERIARETLDIYAPLARSIGVHRICTELEELAFEHLNPVARDAIGRRLDTLRQTQGGAVSLVSGEIANKLEASNVPARVYGREKNPYSIWRKLQRKSIGFSQLSDIFAFRVIVDTEEDCYRALGVIHRAWPSIPERFKDFISTPKRNNYRSLHTTVVGPKGMRIEMQIRTEAMDRVAEEGVAAHWRYKDQSYGFDIEHQQAAGGRDPIENLRHLVQVLEHGGDAEELVEHAKLEMYLDQAFVFTPKGRLVSLPTGAMPLDFAYALPNEEELFGAVGRGRVAPPQVLEAIFPGLKASERAAATARHPLENGKRGRLYVRGDGLTAGLNIHFGECCSPVPGDRIVGILEEGSKDLAVHTIDCERLAAFEDREEVWRDLQWTPEAERNSIARAKLIATIRNAPGVLGQVCTVIGEAGGNIVQLRMHHRQADFFDVDVDVDVHDARHLTHIAAALRANVSVETVERRKD
jgi:(p)ppGpp synthase/HD superfamily hydrolase